MPHRSILAALTAMALAGGVAYAASTNAFIGANGKVHACVPKHGGTLSVVRAGHHCSHGKVGLALATEGTAGPAGPVGATGATGATGASNPSATTVDGMSITKIFVKVPTPATSMATAQLFSGSGLTILGQCDNGGNAMVIANGPSTNDSDISYWGWHATNMAQSGQVSNLGPATMLQIGMNGNGETIFSYASSGGAVVTGTLDYEKAFALGTFSGCVFSGTAISG